MKRLRRRGRTAKWIGTSGLVVNLLLFTLLLAVGMPDKPAVALAIVLSMAWNFALNRRFSFSYARQQSILWQALGFAAGCSIGAVVQYFTTISLLDVFHVKQTAA